MTSQVVGAIHPPKFSRVPEGRPQPPSSEGVMGGALFLSPRPFPPARPPPLPGRGETASSRGLVVAYVLAWLVDQLVAALGEVLVVVLVSWHEDRAALDLALGLVVRLTAPPRISDGKADLVML